MSARPFRACHPADRPSRGRGRNSNPWADGSTAGAQRRTHDALFSTRSVCRIQALIGLWPIEARGGPPRGVFALPAESVLMLPPRSFDPGGRALPLTPEEIDRTIALALQALDSFEDMGDEEEQRETLAYLASAVNEDRLSDRLAVRFMRLDFLDTGPLGVLTKPKGTPRALACQQWVRERMTQERSRPKGANHGSLVPEGG